jgi:predicted site-specific integrase-resolvase
MNTIIAPLDQVTRPTVDTASAAYYLNRKPQTLREWAMTGKVIKPIRINGRLAWPVSEIKRILGATA